MDHLTLNNFRHCHFRQHLYENVRSSPDKIEYYNQIHKFALQSPGHNTNRTALGGIMRREKTAMWHG
jgi:hypothetical protein